MVLTPHLLWCQQKLATPQMAVRVGERVPYEMTFNFIHLVVGLWKSLWSFYFSGVIRENEVTPKHPPGWHKINHHTNKKGSMHEEWHFCCVLKYSDYLEGKHLCNCFSCKLNDSFLSRMPFLLKGRKRDKLWTFRFGYFRNTVKMNKSVTLRKMTDSICCQWLNSNCQVKIRILENFYPSPWAC